MEPKASAQYSPANYHRLPEKVHSIQWQLLSSVNQTELHQITFKLFWKPSPSKYRTSCVASCVMSQDAIPVRQIRKAGPLMAGAIVFGMDSAAQRPSKHPGHLSWANNMHRFSPSSWHYSDEWEFSNLNASFSFKHCFRTWIFRMCVHSDIEYWNNNPSSWHGAWDMELISSPTLDPEGAECRMAVWHLALKFRTRC